MDESLQTLLTSTLQQNARVRLAVLFGSGAAGRLRADSDLDIALLAPTPLSIDERLQMISELQRATGRAIDLVDLFDAHGALLAEIVQRGKKIFARDPLALESVQKRFLYEQEDFMPAYRRALAMRREKFLDE